jgi:hypothetical protein
MAMNFVLRWLTESWDLLAESSIYVIFGLVVGGLLKVFLSPAMVARHLGTGRITSVLKAALLGIPMPLCSCGVLPAGVSLRRQGANKGATAAFLISTPETGVDSIAITYALLGPVMAVARPVAAFATAAVAGIAENLIGRPEDRAVKADLSCPIDACCDGVDCPEEVHQRHHSFGEKLKKGLGFAFGKLWGDLAGWFMVGLLLAGLIGALVPEDVMGRYLGGGWQSMLLMLAVGIPLYICATASTPIAAMLILKGVSPGTALVFLLAGPATNITSLSVLIGVLGKRATAIYLVSIAVMSVLAGLALDLIFLGLGLSAQATVGQADELVPPWLQIIGGAALLLLSIKPIGANLKARLRGGGHRHCDDEHHELQDHAQEVVSCSGST